MVWPSRWHKSVGQSIRFRSSTSGRFMSELSVKALETRKDSPILFNRRRNFNFVSSLKFWTPVFSQVDIVKKRLQNPSISFVDAVSISMLSRTFCRNFVLRFHKWFLKRRIWWGIDVNWRIRRKRKACWVLSRRGTKCYGDHKKGSLRIFRSSGVRNRRPLTPSLESAA